MNRKYILLWGIVLFSLFPGRTWSAKAYVELSTDMKTLTFCYDDNQAKREGTTYELNSGATTPTWVSPAKNVTLAEFEPTFIDARPLTTSKWFYYMKSLESISGIEYLNTSSVKNMSMMFYGCSSLKSLTVTNFNTSVVTDMSYMFYGCSGLTSLKITKFDTSRVTDMSFMFSGCSGLTELNLRLMDTSNVVWMRSMFDMCSGLQYVDVSKFNTSKVTDMSGMFSGCSKVKSFSLGNFDTSKVTAMNGMFSYCSNLLWLNFSNFDTSKVTDMAEMFSECFSLKKITFGKFNTSSVTDMSMMFNGCVSLTNIDLSSFNTSSVTNIGGMFKNCTHLTSLDLSKFDMSNIEIDELEVFNADEVFYGCSALKVLKIPSSADILSADACYGVGTTETPCNIYAPEGFDFGVDTSSAYFIWNKGYFKIGSSDTVTITTAGYATYCSSYDLDFIGVTGLKAFVATGYNKNTGKVILSAVSEIPAGTGLLLNGTAGIYEIPRTTSHTDAINILVGTLEETVISPTEGEYTNFVLSKTSNGLGFYTISKDMIMAANKAYLQIPTDLIQAGINYIGFEFGDESDAIEAVTTISPDNELWYTLDGRKLDGKPTERGIYVTKGRKVLIK